MNKLVISLLLTVVVSPSMADELNTQIDKACLRHAVSLVARLKSDVVGEMSQGQSDQALKLATQSCEAYFKREFGVNPEAIARAKESSANTPDAKVVNTESEKKSSLSDWFKGDDSIKKDGHKRLDRRAR